MGIDQNEARQKLELSEELKAFFKAELREAVFEAMRALQPTTATVTIAEAAKMMGCSISHVNDLITEGWLEVKTGSRPLRVTMESIRNY